MFIKLYFELSIGAFVDADFDWEVHPDLDKFVKDQVDKFISNNTFAKELSESMMSKTSTRFVAG